ncbi:uncharacterized protein LOC124541757 [Vanessa cardui]|uniref:uncharacterized protein LOC124541757 n=1 Tax=Vanessa cardui TaxID=171605 RepID=UPI001F134051|nr:uncharacterized protein LOC124541757 [Vanessa cardui]
MDIICKEHEIQSGWQEIYTDFDGWICKYNKYVQGRSSQFQQRKLHEDIQKSNSQINPTSNRKTISVEDLFAEGFIFSKLNSINSNSDCFKKELSSFLSRTKDGEGFVNYDYVLLKLINGEREYFYQYMKSKL